MRTAIGLFAAASALGGAIAITYWLIAHEPAGTLLLAFTTTALAFTAGCAFFLERDASLEGDSRNGSPPFESDDLGVFTTHSAWPILIAFCSAAALLGMLWVPSVCLLALAALVLCLWRLGAESARAGGRPSLKLSEPS